MLLSPYIALPAELRTLVYNSLFEDLVYPVDYCYGNARAAVFYQDFKARTGILRASHAMRDEALPILERHITVMATLAGDLFKTPQVYRNAKQTTIRKCFPLR